MARYEQILSKISPIFYKLVKYNKDLDMDDGEISINNYLEHANIPRIYHFQIPKPLHYVFAVRKKMVEYKLIEIYNNVWEEIPIDHLVIFITTNNDLTDIANIGTEIIVNMVINNFSFENQKITTENTSFIDLLVSGSEEEYYYEYAIIKGKLSKLNLDFKKYFITLVGKNTYDTIRNKIR
jgi:hypothetical protein